MVQNTAPPPTTTSATTTNNTSVVVSGIRVPACQGLGRMGRPPVYPRRGGKEAERAALAGQAARRLKPATDVDRLPDGSNQSRQEHPHVHLAALEERGRLPGGRCRYLADGRARGPEHVPA